VQSRRIFEETGIWPALYGGEGGGHGYIQTEEKATIAFAANQRDEVRDLHDVAGALGAQPGMKQQTFVAKPLICLNDHGGERMDITEEVTPTLRAGMGGHPPLVPVPNCLNGWDTQQSRVFTPDGTSPTLTGANGGGGRNPAGLVLAAEVVSKGNGDCFLTPEVHTSITGGGGQVGQGYPCVLTAGFCGNAGAEARGIGYQAECSPTIKTGTAPSCFVLTTKAVARCTAPRTSQVRFGRKNTGISHLSWLPSKAALRLVKAFARLFHQPQEPPAITSRYCLTITQRIADTQDRWK
jgi:DNA (cytosine-5)-methyltransferase 1